MAATASALAPPSTNPPPSAAVAAAEGEGKKGLLASVEKPKESRVYDASVLGEPVALSGKAKVWPKLLGARVVYLGEAERVHDPSDKVRGYPPWGALLCSPLLLGVAPFAPLCSLGCP